jgi:ADP-ribose pyrophosphatase YjhB (NUDIX family)
MPNRASISAGIEVKRKRPHMQEKSADTSRASSRNLPTVVPAVSVALIRNGRLLLAKRGRAPSTGLYALPGGKIEAGEDAQAAARRELREETGLCAGRLEPLCHFDLEGEQDGRPVIYRLQVFLAESALGTERPNDDAVALCWANLDEAERLPLTETTLIVARQLFSAMRKL